jgi:hypothetical protein
MEHYPAVTALALFSTTRPIVGCGAVWRVEQFHDPGVVERHHQHGPFVRDRFGPIRDDQERRQRRAHVVDPALDQFPQVDAIDGACGLPDDSDAHRGAG